MFPPINTPKEKIREKSVTNISKQKRSERTVERFNLNMLKRGIIHNVEFYLM
jgi:hypothetical protein